MAELRYGPNGENLVPGTKAYEQGSPFPPTSSPTSGLPTFTPRTIQILIPGVKDPVTGDEAKAWFKFLKN